MNYNGPIIIIEDDMDDQHLFTTVFKSLNIKNEVIFFGDGEKALNYLSETTIEPFIIFSDINMPKLSGIELRKKVHENEDLRLKSIPYLFFTTSADQAHVVEAYSKSIQGFFIKPETYEDLKTVLGTIIDYWSKCISPNYVE